MSVKCLFAHWVAPGASWNHPRSAASGRPLCGAGKLRPLAAWKGCAT